MFKNIPFVDLKAQYQSIKSEIDDAIDNVINDTAFIKGKYVDRFEKQYSEIYGVKNVIGCANGTDAIYIVLKSIGVKEGDEVITVANTWISTSETISQAGGKPVFVDYDSESFTINPQNIESKINSKTKALIVVHLYGNPCQMDVITEICKKNKIHLIEDCAQAHFAKLNGKKVGTFGIAGTFSFFPGKNLGAYGDAGAIITDDDELALKMRKFSDHGQIVKHKHEMEGINSRLDGMQAAILSAKLPYIKKWSKNRLDAAILYNDLLSNIDSIRTPIIRENTFHVFHLYVIIAENRDDLSEFLNSKGIATGMHYPTALPFLEAYKYLNHKPSDFPIAYENQNKILSLPIYPEISNKQIKFICSSIKNFYNA
tara:strand:- start:3417 stop:4529 length:1113 start_codon:yes stop_codon:yes gene_type:complete